MVPGKQPTRAVLRSVIGEDLAVRRTLVRYLPVRLPGFNCACFAGDRYHGVAEAINSAFDSLSVGSTIIVPGTGHDIVGAWNP
jgi:hypothetical protein